MKNFKKFGMKPSVLTSKKLACCCDFYRDNGERVIAYHSTVW